MTGVELIAAERERQVETEGFDAKRDDGYVNRELAVAACYYAVPMHYGLLYQEPWPDIIANREKHSEMRRLVIAGALIAAEIDRLQRKAEAPTEPLSV